MGDALTALLLAEIAILFAGFAYAAVADWRTREVTDRLWQVMGGLGLVLGAVGLLPSGLLGVTLWVVVGALTLQHMFPWSLHGRLAGYDDFFELAAYLVVIALVIGAAFEYGVGPVGAVPYVVIAWLASVRFARGLFEAGLLFGGADAKAVMIAGVLVPVLASPLVGATSASGPLLRYLPLPVNLVMNAALLSAAIPLGLALRNAARRESHGLGTFTGYSIAVRDLPHRFVWVRNPMSGEARAEEDAIETSEQDRQRRERIARELSNRGVARIWVTPQIPYLVVLTCGAVAAVLAGNLVLDLITLV